ncbi:MAG TPA: Sua5/YciO/YrdC/YwlC family protein [Planctomycetota bacterium]|nr:Sua5/YciO/YrdC/YwlC family protein [Planctomycetota bacterium]
MTAPARFDLSRDDPRVASAAAAAALERGELVVVPTETVYGVAAREDRPAALARLARLKPGRHAPFSLAVASLEMVAGRLAPVPATAGPLMRRWWPGPLTLVLALRDGGSVGLRVPGHAWTRALLAEVGVPLLLPSANLPGAPPPVDAAAIDPAVLPHVAVVVDGGRAALGEASTLVAPLPAGLRVLREGVVSRTDLERHARPRVLVVCSGNTCRSPMGEQLLRRALEARVLEDPALLAPRIASRGLHVGHASPAADEAVIALDELGLDLGGHEARALDPAELPGTCLVLCMTAGHRAAVATAAALAGSPDTVVAAFDPSGEDIADPFGGPLGEYRVVARRLAQLARDWAIRLLPPENAP